MEAFLVSFVTVAVAEMGDRTQLLCLVLATRFRRPWPMVAAILVATAANHLVAGLVGVSVGHFLTPTLLDAVVGVSLIAMGAWALKPEAMENAEPSGRAGAFLTTLVAFFLAEIGDKTQIATMALAAGYHSVVLVVTATTSAMLAVNAPVVFVGSAFAARIPVRRLNYIASALFVVLGFVFVGRALLHILG